MTRQRAAARPPVTEARHAPGYEAMMRPRGGSYQYQYPGCVHQGREAAGSLNATQQCPLPVLPFVAPGCGAAVPSRPTSHPDTPARRPPHGCPQHAHAHPRLRHPQAVPRSVLGRPALP